MKEKNNYIVKWQGHNNARIWLILIAYVLVHLFNSDEIFAQAPAPYSYSTPDFTNVYSDKDRDSNNLVLKMSKISKLPEGADALMVEFYVEMDLVKNARLLKFSITGTDILEVFYEKYTMKLRRYLTNDKHYDYELYDALFCMAEASGDPCRNYSPATGTWHVKFYFSSSFMWIQVTKEATAARNYLSPLFFGLNFSTNKYMESFLQRRETARISFGAKSNYEGFKMPNGVKIHAMKYSDLRVDIQNKFSKAHSAPSNNTKSAMITEKDINNEIDIVKDNKVIIYPNPVNGKILNLDITLKQDEILNLSLFDISGKLVSQQKTQALKGRQTIQLDNLPNLKGIYILRIRAKELNLTKKVLFN